MLETSSIDKKIYDFFTPAKKKELENSFDAIYKQFLGKDVDAPKGFIDNLSHQDLATLQHYHGLADTIDLDDLSNEGAFNLFFDAFKQSHESKDIPKNANATSNEMDAATKALLDDLLNKGALRFLQEFNHEKIEKMIEEKRKELEAKYSKEELNDSSIVAQIEEELNQYRKELLEKITKQDEDSNSTSIYSLKDLLALQMVAPK